MSYTADQILDKSLMADQALEALLIPSLDGPVIATFQRGEIVGTVYSWVSNSDGLFWEFLDTAGNSYYILHTSTSFNEQYLEEQFLAEDPIEPTGPAAIFTQFGNSLQNLVWKGALLWAGVQVIKAWIKK